MSEDLKTIRELADELGVSKNKIHYQVSKIPSEYIVRNNSMKLLTAEAIKQIKENLGVELNSTLNSYLNSLKHQIEYLESQNINKDEQIKSLVEAQKQTQNLLDQQQRLALQDKKLLDEYKSEINDLKALKMPTQETEFKHLDNQYKDEVNALKKQMEGLQEQLKEKDQELAQEKPRKWWGLWRK